MGKEFSVREKKRGTKMKVTTEMVKREVTPEV